MFKFVKNYKNLNQDFLSSLYKYDFDVTTLLVQNSVIRQDRLYVCAYIHLFDLIHGEYLNFSSVMKHLLNDSLEHDHVGATKNENNAYDFIKNSNVEHTLMWIKLLDEASFNY